MFSLIITIISIALVAALALATIYYGGTAFNRGTAEAKASQLINEGQQLNGAVALAKADIDRDGSTAKVTADSLVSGNYITQMPAGWTLQTAAGNGTPASNGPDGIAGTADDVAAGPSTAVTFGATAATAHPNVATMVDGVTSDAVVEAISKKAGLNVTANGVVVAANELDAAAKNVYGVVAGSAAGKYTVFYKL